ncbi:MAG: hypothetical protein ACOX0R_00940 [Candidatus Dojkabacteria bacterium]|jgi:hypothetical protein
METEITPENEYVYEREEGIPEFFEPGYVERVVDALPYYFPNYLKERLKREHPDIPVTNIKREYNPNKEEGGEKSGAEKEALRILNMGTWFFDELTTESLALTILQKNERAFNKNTHYWECNIQPFLNGYGEKNGYNNAIELLEKLQVAGLSGNFRDVNAILQEKFNIPSMFELLTTISFSLNRVQKKYENKPPKKKLKDLIQPIYVAGKMNYPDRYIYINTQRTKFWQYMNNVYTCSAVVTGALTYAKANKETLPYLLAITALSTLALGINKHFLNKEEIYDKLTYIHEVLHYLSYDCKTDRRGFSFPNYYDYEKLTETY